MFRFLSPEPAESAPFCWLLSKDSVLLFLWETELASLSLANICPELNFLFQIFSNEKDGILA